MDQPENYILCQCIYCSGKIEFPERGVGTKITCPHCGHMTMLYRPIVPVAHSDDTTPPPLTPSPVREPATPRIEDKQRIRCPYCAEWVQREAAKCKHCGEFLDGRLRQTQKRPPAQSVSSGVFQGLVNFFFVLPLSIVGIIVAWLIVMALLESFEQWMQDSEAGRFLGSILPGLLYGGIIVFVIVIVRRNRTKM